MQTAKIFVVLTLSFLGSVLYLGVTGDTSPRILGIVGFLGLTSLLLGILIGRKNPTALLHLLLVVSATAAIFAGVYWWYSRDRIAAAVALAAAPPAVLLSVLTLRRRAKPVGETYTSPASPPGSTL